MKIVFPLKRRVINRGCQEHKDAGLGCAVDYDSNFEDLFSPVDGTIFLFNESQGGLWIRVTDALGRKWEMAHLSQRYVRTGDTVKAGQKIGRTGNSGTLTTGPHLHAQGINPNGTRFDLGPLLNNAPFPMPDDPYGNMIIRKDFDPGKGQFAYVKGGTKKKQIITQPKSGFALITFIQRSSGSTPLTSQIVGVSNDVWNSFQDVPDGTWF